MLNFRGGGNLYGRIKRFLSNSLTSSIVYHGDLTGDGRDTTAGDGSTTGTDGHDGRGSGDNNSYNNTSSSSGGGHPPAWSFSEQDPRTAAEPFPQRAGGLNIAQERQVVDTSNQMSLSGPALSLDGLPIVNSWVSKHRLCEIEYFHDFDLDLHLTEFGQICRMHSLDLMETADREGADDKSPAEKRLARQQILQDEMEKEVAVMTPEDETPLEQAKQDLVLQGSWQASDDDGLGYLFTLRLRILESGINRHNRDFMDEDIPEETRQQAIQEELNHFAQREKHRQKKEQQQREQAKQNQQPPAAKSMTPGLSVFNYMTGLGSTANSGSEQRDDNGVANSNGNGDDNIINVGNSTNGNSDGGNGNADGPNTNNIDNIDNSTTTSTRKSRGPVSLVDGIIQWHLIHCREDEHVRPLAAGERDFLKRRVGQTAIEKVRGLYRAGCIYFCGYRVIDPLLAAEGNEETKFSLANVDQYVLRWDDKIKKFRGVTRSNHGCADVRHWEAPLLSRVVHIAPRMETFFPGIATIASRSCSKMSRLSSRASVSKEILPRLDDNIPLDANRLRLPGSTSLDEDLRSSQDEPTTTGGPRHDTSRGGEIINSHLILQRPTPTGVEFLGGRGGGAYASWQGEAQFLPLMEGNYRFPGLYFEHERDLTRVCSEVGAADVAGHRIQIGCFSRDVSHGSTMLTAPEPMGTTTQGGQGQGQMINAPNNATTTINYATSVAADGADSRASGSTTLQQQAELQETELHRGVSNVTAADSDMTVGSRMIRGGIPGPISSGTATRDGLIGTSLDVAAALENYRKGGPRAQEPYIGSQPAREHQVVNNPVNVNAGVGGQQGYYPQNGINQHQSPLEGESLSGSTNILAARSASRSILKQSDGPQEFGQQQPGGHQVDDQQHNTGSWWPGSKSGTFSDAKAEVRSLSPLRNLHERDSLNFNNNHSSNKMTKMNVQQKASTSDQQMQCPICLDDFERLTRAPCGHGFCLRCICQTLTSSRPRDICKCPLCREVVTLVSLSDENGFPVVGGGFFLAPPAY
ncbi:unnamed protein product [Amoebophrya sp. A25]|nr:unnamed protein product [Amoebophrya sp. A25]|eukprot:GSA25T00001272001.1